jgi:hypothetical protein
VLSSCCGRIETCSRGVPGPRNWICLAVCWMRSAVPPSVASSPLCDPITKADSVWDRCNPERKKTTFGKKKQKRGETGCAGSGTLTVTKAHLLASSTISPLDPFPDLVTPPSSRLGRSRGNGIWGSAGSCQRWSKMGRRCGEVDGDLAFGV